MASSIGHFDKAMAFWLALALVFWSWWTAQGNSITLIPYTFVILGVAGIPIWLFRVKISARLAAWKARPLLKFILLGYGMVLFEEVFAALFNHLTEGFEPSLFLVRVLQFQLFNLFAFTGLIFAMYFMATRYSFTKRELCYLAGLFGLFTERVVSLLLTLSPLDLMRFFFFAPLEIFIYGTIFAPAILSVEKLGERRLHPLLKYALALFLGLLVFAIIPVLILLTLRSAYPWAFPPEKFIPK